MATYNGTNGDDNITAGSGSNTVNAKEGNNTVTALGTGTQNVTSGNGNDTIITGSGNDTINAGGGNNSVNAGEGRNQVTSGSGNDTITTGAGDDTINAGDGRNIIYAGNGRNNVTTGRGDDEIRTGSGDDTINSGDGNDLIYAGDGANNVNGGNGNDRIHTGSGNDQINALGGDNIIDAGNGHNNVNAGSGNDTITTGSGNDQINAGDGRNVIDAGSGNNNINAGSGDDEIETGDGDDQINAGSGRNTIYAGNGRNQVNTGSGADDITTGSGDDQINAGDGSNVIRAGDGRNSINTGSGADTITSGSGDDQINAGEGVNVIDAGGGDNRITSGSSSDRITTGAGNDDIYAGEGHNVVEAGDGHNDVHTGAGNDQVTTGSGNDAIYAGEGHNTVNAGNGVNAVYTGSGNDTITTGSGADAIYAGEGNNIVNAGDGLNLIYTGSGSDRITTGDGSDIVYSGGGDDIVSLGGGNDLIYLDGGNDVIRHVVSENIGDGDVYWGGSGTDTLQLVLTADQARDARLISDLQRFQQDNNGSGLWGWIFGFQFTAFDLSIRDFEKIEIIAPVDARNDTATVNEDVSTSINVLANDEDILGNSSNLRMLSYDASGVPGTLTLGADNKFTFVPGAAYQNLALGQTATVSFTYTMGDDQGFTDTAAVTITITGSNDGPVAVADVAAITENQSVTVDVLANDTDVDNGAVFTLLGATAPSAKGTASVVNNKLVFNPGTAFDHLALGVTEEVTVSYTMRDQHGATSTSMLKVTVTGTNDGPVAVADTAAGAENATLTVDVLANDTDLDEGAAFTLLSATAPSAKGTASVANNKLVFAPGADFDHLALGAAEVVTLTYTMRDQHGAQSTSTVTVTITGTNDGPVAVADIAAGTENQTLTVDVLANDTDVDDGAVFTLLTATAPVGKGVASVVANKLVFTPGTDFDHLAAGAVEVVTVAYVMRDEQGAESVSTVTFTITGTNDGPVAVADTAAGTENATLTIDVLANDTDVDDGHVFTLLAASAPGGKGVATVAANQLVFTPGADFDHLALGATETITLSYTMRDEHGALSTSNVTVTVTGTNDGPVAVADEGIIDNDKVLTLDVLANDTDLDDGHAFTLAAASAPAGKGVASIVDGQLVYTPGTDFDYLAFGQPETVTLSYTMTDEHGAESTATVTVTVLGTNSAPDIAGDVTGTVAEDAAALTLDALANATDADEDEMTVVGVPATLPAGVGYDAATHSFTLDPSHADYQALAVGESVTVRVAYGVSDGIATSAAAVEWAVTGTNDGPVAYADAAATSENGSLVVPVLANDTDADNGASFTLLSATAPAGKGSAQLLSNMVYFQTGSDFDHLALGEQEIVTVTYVMADEHGAESTSTLTITITGTNDGPVAVADVAAGTENQMLTVDVLANDTDVDDGHVFTLIDAGAPDGKGIAFVENDLLGFDPGSDFDHLAAGASEQVTVTYRMADQFGASSTATLTITVTGTNDGPVAVADTAAGTENETLTIDVLANDQDLDDGHVFTLTDVVAPALGSASIAGNKLVFVPGNDFDDLALGEIRLVTILYTMRDEHGATSSAAVTVTVTGTNDGPVITSGAGDAAGTLAEAGNLDDGTLVAGTPSAAGQLASSDVDNGATATWSGSADGTYGAFAIAADGAWTYALGNGRAATQALAEGESVSESFLATVTDQHGATATQLVTVTITGTNDSPVVTSTAADAAGAIVEAGAGVAGMAVATGQLASSDVDAGATAAWTGNANGSYGAFAIAANGAWTYTIDESRAATQALAQGVTVTESFTATVTDEHGATATQVVTVTITGTNDAPVVVADTGATTENASVTIDVLANDSDVDAGAVLTLVGASAPPGFGTASVIANKLVFAPGSSFDRLAAGTSEVVTVGYTVTDEKGAVTNGTVAITVTGTNDGPVVTSGAADAQGAVAEAGTSAGTPSATGQLASSDVDAGASAAWSGNANGTYGSFAITASGAWTYTLGDGRAVTQALTAGQTVTETFTATVTDDKGATATQAVTVTITGTNDAPVVTADAGATNQNAAVTIDVLANDSDVDAGAVLTLVGVSAPAGYGTAGIVANKLVFTPGGDFDRLAAGVSETVTVSYTVRDDRGAESVSTVAITVTGTNDAPVITSPHGTGAVTEAGHNLPGTPSATGQMTATDVDVGAVLVWSGSTSGTFGNFAVASSGVWTYTLDNNRPVTQSLQPGQQVTETFDVRVSDDQGGTTTQTVTITITGSNDAPVVTSSGGSAEGLVYEAGHFDNGTIWAGVATTGGQLASSDVDANSVRVWSGSANGTYGNFAMSGNGVWTYAVDNSRAATQALAEGQVVTDVFTATVTDQYGATAQKTVTVSLVGTNDKPVITSSSADSQGAVVEAGATVAGTPLATGQLSSTDVDTGATATWTGNANGTYGAFAITAAGAWTYTLGDGRAATRALAAGQTATESFTVTVTDDKGAIATQTVTITVTGSNDAPVATVDIATAPENQDFVYDVLANDVDVDAGRVLTLVDVAAPAGKGAATLFDNKVYFVPGSDFDHLALGASEFVTVTYTMRDEHGVTSVGTINLTVTGTNDTPVAAADTGAGHENQTLTIDVLANDSDVDDGAVLTLVSGNSPSGGAVTVAGNKLVFNPDTAFDRLPIGVTETIAVSYVVQDQHGAQTSGTVSITLTGTNDGPVVTTAAGQNAGSVSEDGNIDGGAALPGIASASGTLTASDADTGSTRVWTGSTDGTYGSFAIGSNGAWTYNLDNSRTVTQALREGQTVTESFTATVTDDQGATATQIVTVTISGTNDTPIVTSDAASFTGAATEAGNLDDGSVVPGIVTATGQLTATDMDSASTLRWIASNGIGQYGNLVITEAGAWTYTLDDNKAATQALREGQVVSDSIQVYVRDERGAYVVRYVVITLTGTNDAPVLTADVATTAENVALTIDVLANDIDRDSASVMTLVAVSTPAGQGSVAIVGNKLVFTPGSDFDDLAQGTSELVTLTYTVRDDKGAETTSTVALTVTGTNDLPVVTSGAADAQGAVVEAGHLDDASVVPGTPTTSGQLTSSDVDTGATATWSGSANGSYGSIAIGANGAWTYTLDNSRTATQGLREGQTATETFTATVTDDKGGTATQAITVTVTGTNDAPVLGNDAAGTSENNSFRFHVTANDTDPDAGAVLTLTSFTAPAGKGIVTKGGNSLNFDPGTDFDHLAAGASETVVLTYTVTDDKGASVTRNATVVVHGTNDLPYVTSGAAAAQGAVTEAGHLDNGTAVPGTATANGQLASGDVDDGATATWSGNANGSYGSFAIAANGAWTYTIDNGRAATQALREGQTVTETFTATVTDDKGGTVTQLVTVTVAGTNDVPVITSSGGSSYGFVVEAGHLDNGNSTVGAPSTGGQHSSFDADSGATATWSGSANGTYGVFTMNANGVWSYVLDNSRAATQALVEGQVIDESFVTTVTDDNGATAQRTVTVSVVGTNDKPVVTSTAADAQGILAEAGLAGAGVALASGQLSASDIDTGASFSWSGSRNGTYGVLTVDADGSWSYALDNGRAATEALGRNQTVTDVFIATVTDDKGAISTQVITLTITGDNDTPVATADVAAGTENQVLTVDVLANDTDDNGSVLTLTSVSGPAGKGVAGIVANKLVFTPGTDFDHLALGVVEQVVIAYTMRDEYGVEASSTATISITGTNDTPVAQADSGAGHENETLTIDVLANDSDVDDGAVLTLVSGNSPSGGTVSVVGNQLVFNPGAAFDRLTAGSSETITISYVVRDQHGAQTSGSVAVVVTGTNDGPIITNPAGQTVGTLTEAGHTDLGGVVPGVATASGTLTSSDADTGATRVWTGSADGTYGSFAVNAAGNWTYTLDNSRAATQALTEGQTVTETFTATVTDDQGATASQQVTVTINGTNDVPTVTVPAEAFTGAVSEAGNLDNGTVAPGTATVTGQLGASDVDAGSSTSWQAISAGVYGSLTITPEGAWSYTLDNGRTATQALTEGQTVVDTIYLFLTDDKGAAVARTIAITVTGTNDSPVVTSSSLDAVGLVTEAGSLANGAPVAGAPVAGGTLATADVDAGSVREWSGSAAGSYGAFTIAANGVWSYVLDNSSAATQGLSAGETRTESFVATATDDHGATVSQTVTVTVRGTNDAPTVIEAQTSIAGTAQELADGSPNENSGTTGASGVIAFEDLDAIQSHSATVTALGAGYVGSFTTALDQNANTFGWNFAIADGALDGMAAGQTRIQNYRIDLRDDQGALITRVVTVTIAGTNDKPVFTGGVSSASFTEESAAAMNASGTIAFQDADLADTHTLSVGAPVKTGTGGVSAGLLATTLGSFNATLTKNSVAGQNSGNIAWAYNIDNTAIQGLGAGQTITLTYTLRVTDSAGEVSEQPVTITLTGTNDQPTIWAVADVSGALNEGNSTAVLSETGSFTFRDSDLSDNHIVTVGSPAFNTSSGTTPPIPVGGYGTLVATLIDDPNDTNPLRTIEWRFEVNDAALQGLRSGEWVNQTYTVQISDGAGGVVTQNVTIRLNGANDALVATGSATASGAFVERLETETRVTHELTGSLNFNDPDVNDTRTVTVQPINAPVGNLVITSNPNGGQANGQLTWKWAAADTALDFLAKDQVLVQQYRVTITDGAGTASQLVTVTLTGTNDTPVISATFASDLHNFANPMPTGLFDVGPSGTTYIGQTFVAAQSTLDTIQLPLDWTGGAEKFEYRVLVVSMRTDASGTHPDQVIYESVTLTLDPDNDANFITQTLNGLNLALVPGQTYAVLIDAKVEKDALPATAAWQFSAAGGVHGDAIFFNGGDGTSRAQDFAGQWTTAGTPDLALRLVYGSDSPANTVVREKTIGSTGKETVTHSATGGFNFGDADNIDTHSVAIEPVGTGYLGGATVALTQATKRVDWTFAIGDADISFLAEGQVLTQTYRITVTDSTGATKARTVDVRIVGANDAPVIIATETVATGTVTELADGDVGENATDLTATGTIAFDDADLTDTHSASVKAQGSGYIGALTLGAIDPVTGKLSWTFTAADAALDHLGAGESLTQLYTVTLADNKGGTVSQTVTVTLTGADDAGDHNHAPTITGQASGAVLEAGVAAGIPEVSGTLIAADADADAVLSWSGDADGAYGSFAIDANGVWTYTLDDSLAATQALKAGDWVSESFTATVTDQHGVSTNQTVTVTVSGSNDAPSVTYTPIANTRPVTINEAFTTGGDATAISEALFQLTEGAPGETGALFSSKTVDFASDFAISFTLRLGTQVEDTAASAAAGGEGIAFVLHTDPRGAAAIGSGGEGLGALGIENGIAIRFNTDIGSTDRMSVVKTSDFSPIALNRSVNHYNLETGTVAVQLVWSTTTNELTLIVNGSVYGALKATKAELQAALGSLDAINFGFTGATGDVASAIQSVRVNSVIGVLSDHRPNYAVHVENAAAVAIAGASIDVTNHGENDIVSLTIGIQGAANQHTEILTVGGKSFQLWETPYTGTGTPPAPVLQTQDITLEGVALRITANTTDHTLTVVKTGGGVIDPKALEALLRGITYNNVTNHPTAGDRTVTFTVTDDAGASSTGSTIVKSVAVNDAPYFLSAPFSQVAEDGAAVSINILARGQDYEGTQLVESYNNLVANYVDPVTGQSIQNLTNRGIIYDAAAHTLTLDGSDADYQYLSAGQTLNVGATYSVSDGELTSSNQAVWTVTGKNDAPFLIGNGQVAQFNGSSTAEVALNGSDGLEEAYELRFRTGQAGTLLSYGTPGQNAITLSVDATGRLFLKIESSALGGLVRTINAGSVADNQWHTVSLVFYGNSQAFLAVDGTIVGSTSTGGPVIPAGQLRIGEGFTGQIAELAVWDRSLRISEVQNLASPAADAAGLVGLYRFDGSTGTTVENQASGLGDAGVSAGVTYRDFLSGSVTDLGDTLDPLNSQVVSTSGTIAFGDADRNDTHVTGFVPGGAGYLGSFALVTDQANNRVTWTYSASGTAIGVLTEGEVRVQTYTINITDPSGVTLTETVSITITGKHDRPVAVSDQSSVNEGGMVIFDPLLNDFDLDAGSTISLVSASIVSGGGSLSVVNGKLVFNTGSDFEHLKQDGPALGRDAGSYADVVIQYTITDEHGFQQTGTATVRVDGLNDAPVTVVDNAAGTQNQQLTIDVLANDYDVDVDASVSLIGVSAPAGKGSATLLNQKLVFTPGGDFAHLPAGATETVVVSYTVQDDKGATTAGSVSIVVTGTNDVPVAVADGATTEQNTVLTIDVLANDTDKDSDAQLSITGATVPAGQGSVSFTADEMVFTPGSDFVGLAVGESQTVVISYTIADDAGATSASTVTVVVTGSNDAPVLAVDTAAGGQDELLVIDVLSNDFDPDVSDLITLASATAPAGKGSVSVAGGFVVFTPGGDFAHLALGETEIVTLSYVVTDPNGGSSTSTIDVTVTGTNDAPVAVADSAAGDQDSTVTIDVLANDQDADTGAVLTLTSASSASGKGSVSIVDGKILFDPGSDFAHLAEGETQVAVISYIVTDEHGAQAGGTVTVTVTGTNQGPVAAPDLAIGVEDDVFTIDVLANDQDADTSDVLAITGVTLPAGKGSASVVGNKLVFTPGVDFAHLGEGQVDSVVLTYTISDGHGGEATGTATVLIHGANDGPVAVSDTATTGKAAAITVDVLANDSDVEGDALTLTGATAPEGKGSVAVIDGKIVFDPGNDFAGLGNDESETVEIAYTMADAHGAETSGTLIVTVLGNRTPAATDDAATGDEGETLLIDVLANDSDADADATLTLTSVSLGSQAGTVSIVDGKVRFDPGAHYAALALGETVDVEIGYVLTDEHGAETTGTVIVTVTGVNQGVVAADDSYVADSGDSLVFDVIANDSDPDNGAVLSVTGVEALAGQTGQSALSIVDNKVVFDASGFDYLAEGESEVFSFHYDVADEHGETTRALTEVTVTGVNDAPVAVADTLALDAGETASIDVLANDSDADTGAVLSLVSVGSVAKGSVSIVDGQVTFAAGSDFDDLPTGQSETVTFDYTIADEHGVETIGTASVTVHGTAEPAPEPDPGEGGGVGDPDASAAHSVQVVDDQGNWIYDDGAPADDGEGALDFGEFNAELTSGGGDDPLRKITAALPTGPEPHDAGFGLPDPDADFGGMSGSHDFVIG